MGRHKAYVRSLMRFADSSFFSMPRSWEVLSRYPSQELRSRTHAPKQVTFPEFRLYDAFYKEFPEARLQPIALNSHQPSVAKAFVLRQLELMRQEKLPTLDAFDRVQQEMKQQLDQMKLQHNALVVMQAMQDAEEASVQEAIKVAQRKELLQGPQQKQKQQPRQQASQEWKEEMYRR